MSKPLPKESTKRHAPRASARSGRPPVRTLAYDSVHATSAREPAPPRIASSVTSPRPRAGSRKLSNLTFQQLANLPLLAREQLVHAGLPAVLLDDAASTVGVSKRALLEGVNIAPTSAARRKAEGGPLSVDDSDRLARLAQLWQDAMKAFGSEDAARTWITRRVPILDAVPLNLLRTSQGYERARTAILQLAYGVYA